MALSSKRNGKSQRNCYHQKLKARPYRRTLQKDRESQQRKKIT